MLNTIHFPKAKITLLTLSPTRQDGDKNLKASQILRVGSNGKKKFKKQLAIVSDFFQFELLHQRNCLSLNTEITALCQFGQS